MTRLRRFAARLGRDRRGSILTLTAVMMPVIMGFSALGVDATLWYMQRRELQSIADASAVAAAYAMANGGGTAAITTSAAQSASRNGFVVGGGNELIINAPPKSGPFTGSGLHVELIARAVADVHFISAFVDGPVTIGARAVAGTVIVGEHCIIGLDEAADKAVEFSGTAQVFLDCGVASNSSSKTSIYVGGNAQLTADPAQAYGDIYVGGNATLNTKHPPQPLSQRVTDPYGPDGRDLQMPPLNGSCISPGKISGTTTLSPGRYCGGLDITNANVTFEPGTYILDGGDFTTSGTSTLNGDGVTFLMTGTGPSDVGEVSFAGGTVANLTASTSGPYSGVLFFQDDKASDKSNLKNSFLGGSHMIMDGALYFPRQDVVFSGGSGVKPACLQIISRKVTFTGNGYLSNDPDLCSDLGVEDIAQVRIRLVE